MIIGIQLIGIIFGLLMIYISFYYYKRNSYSWKSFLLWSIIWASFMIIILIPSSIYGVMQMLSIEKTQDFFIISGLMFYGVLLFYLYATVKESNRKVERLVRTIAFREVEKSKKSGKKKR